MLVGILSRLIGARAGQQRAGVGRLRPSAPSVSTLKPDFRLQAAARRGREARDGPPFQEHALSSAPRPPLRVLLLILVGICGARRKRRFIGSVPSPVQRDDSGAPPKPPSPISERPAEVAPLLVAGVQAANAGDLEAALPFFQRAARIAPAHRDTARLLGTTLAHASNGGAGDQRGLHAAVRCVRASGAAGPHQLHQHTQRHCLPPCAAG